MPREWRGQMISFAVEQDEDVELKKWIKVGVRVGDTVKKIAGRRGHPEDVRAVVKRNRTQKGKRPVRSGRTVLRHAASASKATRKKDRTYLWVPGSWRAGGGRTGPLQLSVLAGDEPPRPTTGYAKFSTVDRPGRVGVTSFDGYDPFTLDVPIRFEAWTDQGGPQGNEGRDIEDKIKLLERMAGRGDAYGGAATGPPPVIRISATDNAGNVVPLISDLFQWTPESDAPLWRVAGIEWDDGALRNPQGRRLRQTATVTLQQHTRLKLATRSASKRNRARRKKK